VRRAVLEVLLAVAAAVGCVELWLLSRSMSVIPPISDGEPATTSLAYDPQWLVLAFVLGTVAGVLLVIGIARGIRSRSAAKWNSTSLISENHGTEFHFEDAREQ
jgi:hypothetical protein